MSKIVLVTVSDDRFGRKDGQYAATQARINYLLAQHNVQFDRHYAVTWKDIEGSEFYKERYQLLRHADAAKNGRAYKPYVIYEAMKVANEGDFVIYSDCSPEMWPTHLKSNPYSLSVIKELCWDNKGILTPFVYWDTRTINNTDNKLGQHTHENFTTNRCLFEMDLMNFEKSYMHASGMVVLQKNKLSMEFIERWLHFNLIPACCALGKAHVLNDYSYWDEHESRYKMGHRHDQSISGLLVNEMNPKLLEPRQQTGLPIYNFLNYCIPSNGYKFIDSNTPAPERKIKKGMDVINEAGIKLRVFEIWPDSYGKEKIIVGLHRESAYQTTEDKLTPV